MQRNAHNAIHVLPFNIPLYVLIEQYFQYCKISIPQYLTLHKQVGCMLANCYLSYTGDRSRNRKIFGEITFVFTLTDVQ